MPSVPKHRSIFESLQRDIAAGKFADGRLPTEQELTQRYGASRPTVARALEALRAQGVIVRRPGAGTFLRSSTPAAGGILGFIGAGIGHTEILGPIGAELARSAEERGHRLILGDSGTRERDAERLCREFLDRGVRGVFLAPLERSAGRALTNRRLVTMLHGAGIAVILLDRDVVDFPARSELDLVAIDDVRAGCVLGAHLLRGSGPAVRRDTSRSGRSKSVRRRLAVVARPGHPSTTDLRLAGCRQAAADADAELVFLSGEPDDPDFVAQVIAQADCVACANDVTAVALIAGLRAQGVSVPQRMRVGGFDNAGAATTSLVPLTTIHMPCRELARQAVRTLLERIAEPQLPARQVLLTGRLVVRRSSG